MPADSLRRSTRSIPLPELFLDLPRSAAWIYYMLTRSADPPCPLHCPIAARCSVWCRPSRSLFNAYRTFPMLSDTSRLPTTSTDDYPQPLPDLLQYPRFYNNFPTQFKRFGPKQPCSSPTPLAHYSRSQFQVNYSHERPKISPNPCVPLGLATRSDLVVQYHVALENPRSCPRQTRGPAPPVACSAPGPLDSISHKPAPQDLAHRKP